MENIKNFLVITHLPYENCLCDFFDKEIDALDYIKNYDYYFHELIEVKNYQFFDIK